MPNQVVAEDGSQSVELLSALNDNYGGVIVEMKESMDSLAFITLLRASILEWRRQVCALVNIVRMNLCMCII